METEEQVKTRQEQEEAIKAVNQRFEEFNKFLADTVNNFGPDVAASMCVKGLHIMVNSGWPKTEALKYIDLLMDRLELEQNT